MFVMIVSTQRRIFQCGGRLITVGTLDSKRITERAKRVLRERFVSALAGRLQHSVNPSILKVVVFLPIKKKKKKKKSLKNIY